MANPAVTNVDGTNPGPNSAALPDTTQSPIGNIQKIGRFLVSLTPAASGAATAAIQNFAATGIGLLPGDTVIVNYPQGATVVAGVTIGAAYVSANDQLSIQFVNPTAGSLTAPAGQYIVTVLRVQPNWTAPASGNQLDW